MLEYDPDKRITLAKALEHEFFNPLANHLRHSDDPVLQISTNTNNTTSS